MNTVYPLGKLPAKHLAKLLQTHTSADPRVRMSGRVGEDAAVIDLGDRYLVAKTDPITFATAEIGWYAVTINANDVATMGATPKWFLTTILLPEQQTTPQLVDDIFAQVQTACHKLNITVAGGHTEITYGLDRPIVVGQMLGEVPKPFLRLTSHTRVGDVVLLTKRVAIEATAIIAAERGAELTGTFSAAALTRLANYLHHPGISVVPEALAIARLPGLHAMHDPTEGGLASGLHELALAADVGLRIDEATIPYDADFLRLAQHFNLDPLGTIASGSLLCTADPSAEAAIKQTLRQLGIPVQRIGVVTPATDGVLLAASGGKTGPLPQFARDEITRLFE